MPARAQGAQRASATNLTRSLIVAIIVALLALSVELAWGSPSVRAGTGGAAPKAVIITGPSSERTQENLSEAAHLARQAEAAGMDVHRVFHPHATWRRVLDVIQGANLVVYFGHGNGWPSPYSPYQEDTKDGFGLDGSDGASAYSAEYYGANKIRDKVRLAPNAVVLLMHLCYAAGNGEPWMGPEFDKGLATKRVDNYANGFLDVGARAVFAFGSQQDLELPQRPRQRQQDDGRDVHDLDARRTAVQQRLRRAGTTTTATRSARRGRSSTSTPTRTRVTTAPSAATWA